MLKFKEKAYTTQAHIHMEVSGKLLAEKSCKSWVGAGAGIGKAELLLLNISWVAVTLALGKIP